LLSGGEHQRIAIARAILRRPRFLILDEPTNHLDGAAVERLIGNLRELESRPSILMVSHDVNVVRLAQWVHVMKEGRIVMSGEPSQVLAGNAGPGLWDFLTRKEAIEDGNR
jgi:ABC-type bacteriocin/lantibiotic exporter with double-glycine peptidase domain